MSNPETLDRFEKFIVPIPECGCHIWTGAERNRGYGSFWDGDKYVLTHRFAWESQNGPIPSGMSILHRCDTPSCVNPSHLFCGTPSDNTNDAIKKGRYNYSIRARGENSGRAVLTEKQVIEMRCSNESTASFSRKFGINFMTLSCARRGKSWKHLPEKSL